MLFMGKVTISMAIFNSYLKLPEGNSQDVPNEMDMNMYVFSEKWLHGTFYTGYQHSRQNQAFNWLTWLTCLNEPNEAVSVPLGHPGYLLENSRKDNSTMHGTGRPPVIKHGGLENGPFISDFPIKASIYTGFPIAMFDYRMVKPREPCHFWLEEPRAVRGSPWESYLSASLTPESGGIPEASVI